MARDSIGLPRSSVRGLLLAAHLGPTVAVTGVTSLLALEAGRGWGAIWVLVAVLAGQLSVGWSNDWLDAERDRLARRAEKPIASGRVSEQLVRNAAVTALVLAVPLSLASGWRATLAHVVAIASAWLYNLWAKFTLWSFLPYGLSFALLPAFVTLGLPDHPLPRFMAVVAAALMGVGAHFINTIPDREADHRTGVVGLPQRLGPERSLLLGVLMLASATVMIAVMVRPLSVFAAVCLAGGFFSDVMVVVEALRGMGRRSWNWTLASAVLSVALFASSGRALVG